MSESGDSVGKVSLEMEVTGDLARQIGETAKKMGAQLENTFTNATKGLFDGLSESIATSMKAINDVVKNSMDEMKDNTKAAIDSMAEVSKGIKIPISTMTKPTEEPTTTKAEPVSPVIPNTEIPDATSSLKSGIDAMTQKIRRTITSVLSSIKNIKMPKIDFPKMEDVKPNTSNVTNQTITRGPPKSNIDTTALKAEMENTANALDIVNAKIEQQQAKLAMLKEEYASTFNEAGRNALEEKILNTESAINSLISKSDKLGFKLADLDAKLASAGTGAGEAAIKFDLLGKVTGAFGSLANGTANMTKKLTESLKGLGSSCNNTNKHMENMHRGLGNIARQFFTWMVVLPLLMKGLEGMTSFLGSALMTNTQFANSLNQIKSNLYTAFMPIYNAILPALNSLMSSLATATAYIASFISQLFGSTYEASFKSAQNLQYSIGAYEQQEKAAKKAATALGAAGNAAKKAGSDSKKGLAGFDEINKLSESTPKTPGDGVVTPITPMANMTPIEAKTAEWVQKFKDLMSKIFDPMKEAWNAEGKNTMDALKYALSSVWDLAKDIGKTFLDVWDNGTGVRVCTDILKLLQTVFNIIGDIATAFKIAWDTGDLGKQVVQALFNSWDAILRLLTTIGQVFREVWNSGIGVQICTNILEILKNIFTIIGQVADSFNRAWQSDIGKQLMTDILNLLNGCLRVIKDITASFSKAWETNGDTIASAILLILDDIVGTISDIANKWANAWESNGNGDKLMDSLLSTLGKILSTIGDIGQGIRESLGKAEDTLFPTLIQFATNLSNGLGNLADGFKSIWDNGGKTLFDGIVQLIAQVGKLILQIAGPAFEDFTQTFKDLSPVIGDAAGFLGTVCEKIADFIGWIGQCSPVMEGLKLSLETLIPIVAITTSLAALKDLIGQATTYIQEKWTTLKSDTSTKWDGITTYLSAKWENIKTDVSTKFGDMKTTIAQKWDDVKTDASSKWESIKTTLSGEWDKITTTSSTTWDSIKKYISDKWTEVNNDAPGLWDKIRTTLGTAWNNISTDSQGIWNGIVNFINNTFSSSWGDAWGNIVKSFGKIWDGLKDLAKAPINAVIGWINTLLNEVNTVIKALNKIKVDIPGGKSWSLNLSTIDNIPALATGGIIDSPTLAMVGEAGKEAVMPLENNTGWIDHLAGQIASKIGGNNSQNNSTSSSGDTPIILMLDGEIVAKSSLSQFRKMKKQGVVMDIF